MPSRHLLMQRMTVLVAILAFVSAIGCGSDSELLLLHNSGNAFGEASTPFAAPKKPHPESDQPVSALIGVEGGKVEAEYQTALTIPAGALLEPTLITMHVSDETLLFEPQQVHDLLTEAYTLASEQYLYTNALPGSDDGSGEWAKNGTKNNIRGQVANVMEDLAGALEAHQLDEHRETLRQFARTEEALDELDSRIESLVTSNQPKMGLPACSKIQDSSDFTRVLVEDAKRLYSSTLLFEFGPHGTQFLVPVELVVPMSEVEISSEVAWYSGDCGNTIEVSETHYFIEPANQNIHFLIEHFSQYYYRRN